MPVLIISMPVALTLLWKLVGQAWSILLWFVAGAAIDRDQDGDVDMTDLVSSLAVMSEDAKKKVKALVDELGDGDGFLEATDGYDAIIIALAISVVLLVFVWGVQEWSAISQLNDIPRAVHQRQVAQLERNVQYYRNQVQQQGQNCDLLTAFQSQLDEAQAELDAFRRKEGRLEQQLSKQRLKHQEDIRRAMLREEHFRKKGNSYAQLLNEREELRNENNKLENERRRLENKIRLELTQRPQPGPGKDVFQGAQMRPFRELPWECWNGGYKCL